MIAKNELPTLTQTMDRLSQRLEPSFTYYDEL